MTLLRSEPTATLLDHPGKALVRDEADVVIVGTGPGGATAARVLAEAGVDVLLVEEGQHWPVEKRPADAWSGFRGAWRDASLQVAQGRVFWPILQGCAVGGTTPVNGAIIHRMPPQIHELWTQKHGFGELLAWDRLERAWDQLDEELSVEPGPAEVLGRNNELFRKGADSQGMVSNVIRRCARGCRGTARCNQACPTAAKQSMDVTYLPYAQQRGARLYATCRVEEVIREGGRAAGVRGRFRDPSTGRTGAPVEFRARHAVILAAGAIHTPLLLLQAKAGRPSGRAGKGLMTHPGTSILPIFDEPVNLWFGITQGHESTHYWHEGMKFEVVSVPPAVAAARLPGFGPALMERLAGIQHVASWGLQIRAEAVGRVKRGFAHRPSIRYDLTNHDIAKVKIALKRLVAMAFGAGARSVILGVHGMPTEITDPAQMAGLDQLPDDPKLIHAICAHLFGTAGISADERSGVLSETGEVWDAPGLYVMDASALPTNMGVNPQHTICAVAWLMAERLAERLRG